MKDMKGASLDDRLKAAAEAKAALLAKLKPKPTVTDPQFAERGALRAAELKAVRDTRAADKQAAKQAAADAAAALEAAALADKRGVRKERKQLSKAEAQAKRDARYAARKAR